MKLKMIMVFDCMLVWLFLMTLFVPFATGKSGANRAPRLILQITVDQLRKDMPLRVYDRLSKGGFRYLYEQGTVYEDAHHRHANTETIVGHATLATGADPAVHGLIGNIWLDQETGKLVYNIEDDRYPLLGEDAGVDKATEIDPAQKAAGTQGRSPQNILVTTFSDELALNFDGRAKVFAVSIKDRGAVSMAGHAGKAFWFSKKSGEFVTSTYYYDRYPDWVVGWNAKRLPFNYAGQSWVLMKEKSGYLFGDKDDMSYETDFPGFGRVFPHPFGKADGRHFTTLLTLSPAGDELTLDFAKELIENEHLGADEIPDYLSISFSSTDYIGHMFGPSSLESEDQILRLDFMLENLFRFVDNRIGLNNTVIVLSADHGAAEIPGRLNEFGIEAAYFKMDEMDRQTAIAAIKQRFGIGEALITGYHHPYVYLNQEIIAANGLDPNTVARTVAAELTRIEGVSQAWPSCDLMEGRVPDTFITSAVIRNFNPKRSGDIYVVFEPHWFVNDFDGLEVASTHGSPWRYDTFVPIIFAGNAIPAQRVFRKVETVDVAATLSAYMGIKSPSGAGGRVLAEVFSSPK